MKTCNICGESQPVTEFAKNRNTCKACKRETNRKWYLANAEYQKTKVKARNKRYRKELQKWFKGYKEQQACSMCPEDCSVCLDFHHLEGKDFNIGDVVAGGRVSIARLLREIEKCVVLCSNCHRKVHAGILPLRCKG